MLESDLENHQAQLSRFQLHVTSVYEQIVSMESQLNSTVMTLKKTLVSEARFSLTTILLTLHFFFFFFFSIPTVLAFSSYMYIFR